jgi:SNF2 family DNA or RNA helicase
LYKTKAYAHQSKVLEETKDREYFGLLMEQGTGKTKIIIDNASYLYNIGNITAVVVLAPNGVHSNWIHNEIPTHSAVETETFEWVSSKKGKKWNLALENFVSKNSTSETPSLKYLCINIEAVRTKNCMSVLDTFMKHYDVLLCLDESTVTKNPKAQQTKAAFLLANKAKYRRILTGTPITQSPLDIFSQAKFLHPEAFGERMTWTAFKNTYAVEQIVTMGPRSFRKISGYKNLDDLTDRLNKFSVRILKKDCLDLPDKIYQNVYVEMTPEQTKLYNDMKDSAFSQLDSGELTSVQSALTLLMKLQQIVSGFIKDDEGEIHILSSQRIQRLLEVVDTSSSKKHVIFCAFKENVRQLHKVLEERTKGSVRLYFGDTSLEERNRAVEAFNNDESVHFFIATSAASKGLTLTASASTLYFSQGYSLETRLQSEDRIHRIGQSKDCTYTDLVTAGTTDELITKALKHKHDLANSVLDDLRKI